jgi:hypothetical protein
MMQVRYRRRALIEAAREIRRRFLKFQTNPADSRRASMHDDGARRSIEEEGKKERREACQTVTHPQSRTD